MNKEDLLCNIYGYIAVDAPSGTRATTASAAVAVEEGASKGESGVTAKEEC